MVHMNRRNLFVEIDMVTKAAPGARAPGEGLLRRDVLDRRLIDVVAGRLVHANDLVLARIDDAWHLVGVDPNPRGILQRLVPGASRGDRPRQAPVLDWSGIQPFVGHVPTAG